MIARLLLVCVVLAVCLLPGRALAQQVPIAPQFATQGPAQDPQKLQLPLRAPFTLLPTITLSEEYNDNILLDNHNRTWDLITGITPAINLIWESRTHRLIAGYNFTAELYLRDPTRDNAFNTQNFNLDGMWRATERLTLTLADAFTATTDTNLISPAGVSVGRNRSWGNALSGGAAYKLDEFTAVRGGASYALQRFSRGELDDSDVYHGYLFLDRTLTRQVRGSIGYDFGYFDIEHEDKVTTHTPKVGASWQVTPTITLAVNGGGDGGWPRRRHRQHVRLRPRRRHHVRARADAVLRAALLVGEVGRKDTQRRQPGYRHFLDHIAAAGHLPAHGVDGRRRALPVLPAAHRPRGPRHGGQPVRRRRRSEPAVRGFAIRLPHHLRSAVVRAAAFSGRLQPNAVILP
ncbi:MAG: hypothetical protein DME02_00740 [Candidatus Rokuibacteriota bacterium]|nr:MAG: hypothetical protein DME02_00740 [Candidatus Rokubacteria bacterium]